MAMRACFLKSTVIDNAIYQKLDWDYGKYDLWTQTEPKMEGLRGKHRMEEAEVFIKGLMDMDELKKSMNALRFTEHVGMSNPLLNKVKTTRAKKSLNW